MRPYDWDQDPWDWLGVRVENSNLKLNYVTLDGMKDGARRRPDLRIVSIESGAAEDPLRCSLMMRRDGEAVEDSYEAVSYVWGSADERMPIRCKNGEPGNDYSYGWIMVTRNCAEVFRALRLVDRPRLVWIDAISIDQDDNDDRIHFVRQMHNIFRQASRVNVVLPNYRLKNGKYWAQPTLGSWLFKHKYFTRIWILQEVFYGRSPIVYAGEHRITWAELCDLYEVSSKEPDFIPDEGLRISIETVLAMGQANTESQTETRNRLTLLELFRKTRAFEATDERDKIIALISMARGITDAHESLLVNYNTSYNIILHRFIVLACFETLHLTWPIRFAFYYDLGRSRERIDGFMDTFASLATSLEVVYGHRSTNPDPEAGTTALSRSSVGIGGVSQAPTSKMSGSSAQTVKRFNFMFGIACLGLWISSMLLRDVMLGFLFIFVLPVYGLVKLGKWIWTGLRYLRGK